MVHSSSDKCYVNGVHLVDQHSYGQNGDQTFNSSYEQGRSYPRVKHFKLK